jgi:hypothetical protein
MSNRDLSTENLRRRLDSYLTSRAPSLAEIKAIAQKAGVTLDDDLATIIEHLDPFRERYVDLVQALPEHLSSSREWLLDPANVAFIVGQTPRLNAVSMQTSTGYVVVLNKGQITLMYKIIRAMCTRIAVPGEPIQELDDLAGVVAQTLDWLRSRYNAPISQDFPIGPEQLRIASHFAVLAETFILCHELSHILRGHLAGRREEPFLNVDGTELKILQARFEEEVAADLSGVELLLDVAPRLGYTLDAAVAGYELSLFSTMLLEYAMSGYDASPTPLSTKHPPARYRIGMLRQHVAGELGHPELLEEHTMAYQNSQTIYTIAGRLKRIQDDRDETISGALSAILDQAATRAVPSHVFEAVARQALMDAPRVALPMLMSAASSSGSSTQKQDASALLARQFLEGVVPRAGTT